MPQYDERAQYDSVMGRPVRVRMSLIESLQAGKKGKKIPHPVPKFWRSPLPGWQTNPESRQDILRFPESRTVFWSNPGSREYPSRP